MRNSYRARAPIKIAGQDLVFEFDYDTLATIRAEIGDDKAIAAVLSLQRGTDVEQLCVLMAIGLRINHPGWTAERVRKAKPAITLAVNALNEALSALYFGPEGPPEEKPQNPLKRILQALMGRRIRSGATTA